MRSLLLKLHSLQLPFELLNLQISGLLLFLTFHAVGMLNCWTVINFELNITW